MTKLRERGGNGRTRRREGGGGRWQNQDHQVRKLGSRNEEQ